MRQKVSPTRDVNRWSISGKQGVWGRCFALLFRGGLHGWLGLWLMGSMGGWAGPMKPIAVTGFNRDLVVERTAVGPPYHAAAVEFNPGENLAFYQAGLPGKSYGLPTEGRFVSEQDGETEFAFAPYDGPNALVLSSATGLQVGTLTLVQPALYRRIAVIAHSASGGGSPSMTLRFADGRAWTTPYAAPDWFNNTGYALRGVERINLTTGATQGAPTNPRFYQTTVVLEAALGPDVAPLVAIDFEKAAGAGSTGIYAVSGEPWPETPPRILQQPASQTVVEPAPARFEVSVSGQPYPALQWFRDDQPMGGATNRWFELPRTSPTDDGARFFLRAVNVITGNVFAVTSAVAVLRVIPDTNPPALLRAWSAGLTSVVVRFSEPVALPGALHPGNYELLGPDGPVAVREAAASAAGEEIVLVTAPLVEGLAYTLSVSNVTDRATAANSVPPGTRTTFIANRYRTVELGGSNLLENLEIVPGGMGLSVRGSGWNGTRDEGVFLFEPRTGDFDLRIRVESLAQVDPTSTAGLMVRESLDPGAACVAVLATPTVYGCCFLVRTQAQVWPDHFGSFPANHPHTWLRLRRRGNLLKGYAGVDGLHWTRLGSVTLAWPATVPVGVAAASGSGSMAVHARLRDFSPVTEAAGPAELPFEPPGPCTRLTSLIISEIMYHPTNGALEFIELLNTRAEPEDISGYHLDGSVQYTFPPGTILPAGGLLVVARDPATLAGVYGLTQVFGPWTNTLPNDNGRVQLRHRTGAVFLDIAYRDQPPWPVAADGAGPSLVLARPSLGENDPHAWRASQWPGGSPGRLESFVPDVRYAVRINEFLAHTDWPVLDYVELFNASTQTVDLGGCILSDDPAIDRFRFPGPTLLGPGAFLVLTEAELGFALDAAGETIFLRAPDRRVLDAVRFGGQANGVASGRWPDGQEEIFPLRTPTPGAPNDAIRIGEVILNEIYYHPISEDDDDQFVELHNRTDRPIPLAGWQLDDGIRFTFPDHAVLPAHGYIVVARDAARLQSRYPQLNPTNLFGNFSGRLARSGERVALTRPDWIVRTNDAGQIVTNLIHIVVDEVTYRDGGRWPRWADGGGSSLERIHPDTHGRRAGHWADSDETRKAPWTVISATGTIDHGSTTADQLQVLPMGAGECLIDDVQVLTPTGSNLIANGTFEAGASGWTAEGTLSRSGWESSEGYNSGRSYRIRAADRGDNQINRVRAPLTATLAAGTTNVTLRAAVRWLKGHPQILLRLRGNWLECAGDMTVPSNPGTPGLPNSRLVANAPPAIHEVRHHPVLPAPDEPVRITARVDDFHGVDRVRLWYRLDPATNYVTLDMRDDGRNGDALANDGLYTVLLPGQPTSTLIAFFVEATDAAANPASSRFPEDAPARECLVRVGEVQPAGSLPVYRIWMTRATLNAWTGRHKLDNTPLDVTFVSGDHRVIYNAGALYAGSPYIAPGFTSPLAGRCGYTLEFPKDDRFLGDTDLVLDWPGGHGGETTAIQEQIAWWIADQLNLPYSHRYHIRLHVNGVTDEHRQAIFEAVHQPGRRFVEAWSPDQPDGQFFKIDRAFEFNDSGSLIADPMPRLQNYTTTGGAKKRERYRWTWMYRATPRVHDYTNLFALVDALNAPAPEPYTTATMGLVDLEQWMRMFAFEHIIVNFDSWGHEIGKNMYTFLPKGGRWVLYAFDLDWLMLVSPRLSSRFAPDQAALFTSDDPTVSRMYAHPPFQRAYWRAVRDAVEGPLNPARAHPVMDGKYQALRANNVRWCDGQALTDPSALKSWFAQRRAFLQAQLAAVASAFTVNPNPGLSNGMGVLTGTAPVEAVRIALNGVPWSVRWITVTQWVAVVPLQTGTNTWIVTALDAHGQTMPGSAQQVTFFHQGPQPPPEESVVIHEILYRPSLPGAAFVELYNRSPTHGFDLSGWRFNGLDYDFPAGTFLPPQGWLVLAADRAAFMTVYGPNVPLFDVFAGQLQADGETLSLLRPAPDGTWIVVDRVRYEATPPWPLPEPGQSLQLRDPARDNSRVANWAVASSPAPGPDFIRLLALDSVWRFQQGSNLDAFAWATPAFSDATWPAGAALLAFENNSAITPLVRTTLKDPRVVTNNLSPGHAYYFRTHLVLTQSLTGYTVTASAYVDDGAAFYVNGREIYRLRMPAAGAVAHNTLATAQPSGGDATSPDVFTLDPTWFVPGTNVVAVSVHQNSVTSSDIVFGLELTAQRAPASAYEATPAGPNSVATALPEFPTLWLNEVQPDNLTGPIDGAGQREPWVEIYNPGPAPVALDGFYLSDRYDDPAQWAFPSNAVLPPGGFALVWCDGQPDQTTETEWHASFRLAPITGTVALARRLEGAVQLVDYLNYTNLPGNRSYGSYPDAQPFYRRPFHRPTPAGTNDPAAPPVAVFINEWMADNTRTLADPADGQFEDWFELYSAGDEPVDLGGYYLSDNLANPTQYRIPATGRYVVPPRGFLLVWADSEPGQNRADRPELHVSFALARGGEAIGLFAPDGTLVDAVTFGPQAADVSRGRFPDGQPFLRDFVLPTPNAPNRVPNTPPRLVPIAEQRLYLGQTLRLQLIASDEDFPPQTLLFQFGSNPPAGASLHPVTGWLEWTPVHAPDESWFEVRVTDDGQPPLSASLRFRVQVRPRPTLAIQRVGQGWELSWTEGTLQEADEVTGPYRDLSVSPPFPLSNQATQKFYRIRIAP